MNKSERTEKLKKLILLGIPVTFYLFFALFDGPVICVDSPSYIEMSISREPFYPTFLALLRWIFGAETDSYLNVAVIIQGLLTGYCTFSLVYFVFKETKLKYVYAILMTFICLGTSIACRFLAQRGSMYSTCIMTESICIPLFLLFSKQILSYVLHQKRKNLLIAALISLILITTRKQMYISLFLLMIAMVYVLVRKNANIEKSCKRYAQSFVLIAVMVIGILGANKAFEYTYANVISGETHSHFNDNRFLTTVAYYVAEPEDSKYLENPDIKKLFEEIYQVCDSEGSMMHDASGGIVDRIYHFGDHYDMIQIDHMWPMTEEFVRSQHPEYSNVDREQLVDEIFNDISRSILPHNWTKLIALFLRNMIQGLVNTVGKATISIMYPYAMVVFALFIILMIVSIRKDLESFTSMFSIFTLLAFLLNDGLVLPLSFARSDI